MKGATIFIAYLACMLIKLSDERRTWEIKNKAAWASREAFSRTFSSPVLRHLFTSKRYANQDAACLHNPPVTDEVGNLSLVISFIRHGARTPVVFLEGDPNNNYWTENKGELSNIGKQQVYEVGRVFRKLYGNFISPKYLPKESAIKSTISDRTIMSAQCFLAGLYPPKGTQLWNPAINWQPIPVHYINYNVDEVAATGVAKLLQSCSNVSKSESDSLYETYKTTITAIEEATNTSYGCLDFKFFSVLDTLMVENFYNLSLPFGLNSLSHIIKELKDAMMIKSFTSPGMGNIINGGLLDEVAQILEAHRNKTISQKLFSFLVHDVNILPLLSSLTESKLRSPPFAASVIFEVYNNNNVYNVRILHRPEPLSKSEPQYIRNCGEICPLDKFLALVKNAALPVDVYPCPC